MINIINDETKLGSPIDSSKNFSLYECLISIKIINLNTSFADMVSIYVKDNNKLWIYLKL